MSDYYAPAEDVLPLFAAAKPTAVTSREARASIGPHTLTTMQAAVYRFIARQGERGATDEECQLGLGMNPSSQRPRRGELEDFGLIVEAGKRATASGRRAVVWKVR